MPLNLNDWTPLGVVNTNQEWQAFPDASVGSEDFVFLFGFSEERWKERLGRRVKLIFKFEYTTTAQPIIGQYWAFFPSKEIKYRTLPMPSTFRALGVLTRRILVKAVPYGSVKRGYYDQIIPIAVDCYYKLPIDGV